MICEAPDSAGSPAAITTNTIDARPRGPNHPMNPTVGSRAWAAEQSDGDREHPDYRQAEGRVDGHRGVDTVQ